MTRIKLIVSAIVITLACIISAQAGVSVDLDQLSVTELDNQFFVVLKEQASLEAARDLPTKAEKGRYVYQALKTVADSTQRPVITILDRNNVQYKPYWIQNMILVFGDSELRTELANHPSVAGILPNRRYQAIDPGTWRSAHSSNRSRGIEWSLQQINADDVWSELGVDGEGIIVCDNDTGVDWDHPALINQYRGWNGTTADHNYNWFDSTGTSLTEPIDDNGHGTHTTGTSVGYDGDQNQIGVAPGATWIGTKCMNAEGGGEDQYFHDCFQWILAPTDTNGQNPDPTKAPHVVNNSWGYSGGNDPVFEADVLALVNAGIFIEVSSGNEGPDCQTLRSPSDYDTAFTTGSTNQGGLISSFSSRGPSQLYPTIAKPEVVAPGANIRSSVPGGGYEGGWSGTSMAGPHTTGLVALMWSANPALIGDIDTTRQLIQDTAVFSDVMECSGTSRSVPNNVYGWGEIDCLAAVVQALPPQSEGYLVADKSAYMCSDTLAITVKDSDLAGSAQLTVFVTSTSEPSSEAVILSETTAGLFEGSIAVVTGTTSPDGNLQVTETDTITVTYTDEDFGGAGPMTLTRTALVDCTAPIANEISVDTLTSVSAIISWNTDEASTTGILFGETAPLENQMILGRHNTSHSTSLMELTECTDYLFAIETTDAAGNTGLDDNDGQYYTFKTWRKIVAFTDNFNSDPGWETEGDWAFGVPQGNDGDPTSGATGQNVYGYNLEGAYTNNMPVYGLTSPPFDLSNATRTTIGYSLWVGVGAYPDDQLGWHVSIDGGKTWIPLFDNSYFGEAMQMDFWIPIEVPLGQLIDGQSDVRFRWTMGPTDATEVYGGWNIDDFWISYDADCDLPTPTPQPTVTPEPTATPPLELGVRIDVPSMIHPTEIFHVTGYLDNPGTDMENVPVFFILDIFGEMWFWPNWVHYNPPENPDIDFQLLSVPTGTLQISVLPEFAWPDTVSGSVTGLFFYGAMLNAEMNALMGNMAAEQWGYAE